ncbi:MAG: hypothetical protein R6X19_04665 [Kiritimatiellia bacterium]
MTLSSTHRLAWDGLSFDIPLDWDLAYQETRLGITRIRLEDPVAVRLSAEWMTPAGKLDLGRIMARFQSSSKKLRAASKDSETLSALPPGWSAVLFRFPDDRRLGLAFFLAPKSEIFAFFQIHLDPGSPGEAAGLLRRFIASFQRHTHGPVPWACYDVAFTVPAGFHLASAEFNPGLKRFTFERSLRRLHVWHVSLADMVLKREQGVREWAVKRLNASPLVRGPEFAIRNGAIAATRPRLMPWCHFMEIVRGCLLYKVGVKHDTANNRLVLVAYHYRFESDLAWLAGTDLPV